jgi:hypothetical protein
MRFAYLRDPLFLGSVLLYLANRLVLKPLLPNAFCHSYLNDLLCLPLWVPVMLWIMRRLSLRHHDRPPEAHEILVPLILWPVIFELVLPQAPGFTGLAISDYVDVLFHAAGGLLAAGFWRTWYREPSLAVAPEPQRSDPHGQESREVGPAAASR